MEAAAHSQHEHHEMPTSGSALNAVAFSATLHCLTGCAIGEVLGMIIGTALGFSDLGTIALAVALAFLFGYTLTSLPLLRAGMALAAVIPIALATDTFSIAVMEIVDNGIMLIVPGAMESGVGDILFWGALSVALVVAGVIAFPVNRWLITRGKGHAVLHETGIHGGPPTKLVAFIAGVAAVFGTAVLVGEAVGKDSNGGGGGHGGEEMSMPSHGEEKTAEHGEDKAAGAGHESKAAADPVRGLSVSENGMKLQLQETELPRGQRTELRYRIVDSNGQPVRDYEVEHDKRMHLIVARRDMTGFQHLHPEMSKSGEWSAPIRVREAGSYRVFADFKRDGENNTLAGDVAVDGPLSQRSLPAVTDTARTSGGYTVRLDAEGGTRAGKETELAFSVSKDGRKVHPQDYLGAKGHLVALREGDLAYLHVHPVEAGHGGERSKEHNDAVAFATEFPTFGRYRLFLQFKDQNRVHTAAFTEEVAR